MEILLIAIFAVVVLSFLSVMVADILKHLLKRN